MLKFLEYLRKNNNSSYLSINKQIKSKTPLREIQISNKFKDNKHLLKFLTNNKNELLDKLKRYLGDEGEGEYLEDLETQINNWRDGDFIYDGNDDVTFSNGAYGISFSNNPESFTDEEVEMFPILIKGREFYCALYNI
jgi:flavorubredoxin